MAMVYTIWPATSGNGVRIGMALITTVNRQRRTHQDRSAAPAGCCGVVVGSTLLIPCA